jgi:hypothetical protein
VSDPRTEPNTDEVMTARILEIANMREESNSGALVDMPDEEEWGEIVGLARTRAKELCDEMERRLEKA